jgi:hypothetical protein
MQTPDGDTFYFHQPSSTSHWNLPALPPGAPPLVKSQKTQSSPSAALSVASPFSSQRPASAAPRALEGSGTHRLKTLSDLSVNEVSLIVHRFLISPVPY